MSIERELPSIAIPTYPRVVASELGALVDVELPTRIS
jgi:hypothetical protein